jgi:hypothetical protein
VPTIAVTLIEHVLRCAVTADGRHAVLWLRIVGDGAMPLAVPCEQVPLLIDRCALALSQSERISRSNSAYDDNKAAVNWWNASVDPQSRELALDLTFGPVRQDQRPGVPQGRPGGVAHFRAGNALAPAGSRQLVHRAAATF